jgi:pyridoxal phosphate-dependent aminotransferase EpsN
MVDTNSRIYLSPPHLGTEEENLVLEAFRTNWIAPLGPHVDKFESELAQEIDVRGALALNSGTAAIHLALKLLGVGRGDYVFCSTLTFAASANPILYLGAEPVFIDSEPESWNMSSVALRNAFKEAEQKGNIPKAVIVVNLYGQSADMDLILEVCNEYHVPVIEDAAESLGATYKGKASGTFGEFGVLSFNGNKIITTSGGGMLVSNNLEALEKARFWSTQSRDMARHYQHSEIGYNYRLSNVLAAIGRGQLSVLQERVNARRKVFERYQRALSIHAGISFMPEASYGRCNRWLTVMTIDTKKQCGVTVDNIIDHLESCNIEARPVWKPMHLQPLFEQYSYFPHSESNSISNELFGKGICLPSGSSLTEKEQNIVINEIKVCLQK